MFGRKITVSESQIQAAKTLFDDTENLLSVISDEIFPALVVIKTDNGRIGMGFFYHAEWLVSNAHVIKDQADIDGGIILRNSTTDVTLVAKQAYHRPWNNQKSPDIVVIKTNNHESLRTVPPTNDSFYNKMYYFYVDAELLLVPIVR